MRYTAYQFLTVLEGLAPPNVNDAVEESVEESAEDEGEDTGPLADLERQLRPLRRQAFERLGGEDLEYHQRVALMRLSIDHMLSQADRFCALDPDGWHPDGQTDRESAAENFADVQQGIGALARMAATSAT